MALPSRLKETFLPSEIFFLAENDEISIIPRQSMNPLNLISTTLPRLRPMRRVKVSLWLAILLKKQGRCNIVPPDWLNEDFLKEMHKNEIQNPDEFSKLPWNWLEISQLFLTNAPDDLPISSTVLKTCIRDLREVRLIKSRRGIKELNESHVQLDNLGILEINEMRPYVANVMDGLRRLQKASDGEGPDLELDYEGSGIANTTIIEDKSSQINSSNLGHTFGRNDSQFLNDNSDEDF